MFTSYPAESDAAPLARRRDVQLLLVGDEVVGVFGVIVEVDLDPADGAAETARGHLG